MQISQPKSVSYRKNGKIHSSPGFSRNLEGQKASDIVLLTSFHLLWMFQSLSGVLGAHYQSNKQVFGDAIMIKQLIGPKYPIDMFVQSFLVWNKTE